MFGCAGNCDGQKGVDHEVNMLDSGVSFGGTALLTGEQAGCHVDLNSKKPLAHRKRFVGLPQDVDRHRQCLLPLLPMFKFTQIQPTTSSSHLGMVNPLSSTPSSVGVSEEAQN